MSWSLELQQVISQTQPVICNYLSVLLDIGPHWQSIGYLNFNKVGTQVSIRLETIVLGHMSWFWVLKWEELAVKETLDIGNMLNP